MSEARTELEELGEFGLIEKIGQSVKISQDSTVKGIGDDCAVIDAGNHYQVITTDMLVEHTHFNLAYAPLKHLGYKAVVVNLSDVYAMNASPKQITVSIAISNRFSLEAVDELYGGINLAAKKYGVDVVGGDTTSSKSGLVISVTAIGTVEKENVVYRSTANEHDLIVVSGDLGSAYLGLQVLEREMEVFKVNPNMQPDLSGHDYILERQLKPEARKDVVEFLKGLEIKPTSMIDISDGLASEVLHLSRQSNLGSEIFVDKIPIDPITMSVASDFNLNPVTCALSGGEDYEILFTISQADYDKIKGSPHFTVIGYMKDKSFGNNLVMKDGSSTTLTAQGWDALLKKELS